MPQPDSYAAAIPYAAEFLGAWAMTEEAVNAQLAIASRLNLHTHLAGPSAVALRSRGERSYSYEVQRGVAVIELGGTLMKHEASMTRCMSTVMARRTLRAAVADPSVKAIVLAIDSPGGTVAGTADLADEVYQANQTKPVVTLGEDLVASAAYYVGSQAGKFYTTRSSLIGSIGVYAVLHDLSAMAAMEGVKVHVIKSADLKGAGVAGTEVTSEQLVEWQVVVDAFHRDFVQAVARGRRLSEQQVRQLADGRVHHALAAEPLGLIDGVRTLEEVIDELAATTSSNVITPPKKEKARMAATYTELVEACGGIKPSQAEDAQFLCDQLAQGVDADAAARNWTQTLVLRADAAREERAAAERRAVEAEQAKARTLPGTDPLLDGGTRKSGSASYGDAVSEMDAAVRERRASHPSEPRRKAVLAVARENPQLHRAYIEATNPGRRAQALIADRFDGE